MIGTEKQIAWATEIKKDFEFAFIAMAEKVPGTHKAMFDKCRDAIMGIEYSAFWIENKDFASPAGIENLCSKLVAGTLKHRGSEYSDTLVP